MGWFQWLKEAVRESLRSPTARRVPGVPYGVFGLAEGATFAQGVELLDDAATTMELVVSALESHAGLRTGEALAAMLTAHENGGVVVAMPSREAAEAAVAAILQTAATKGAPLRCRVVTAGEGAPPPPDGA